MYPTVQDSTPSEKWPTLDQLYATHTQIEVTGFRQPGRKLEKSFAAEAPPSNASEATSDIGSSEEDWRLR
jgi:hypothetical protein